MIKQINQFTWEALGNLTRGLNFVIRLPKNIIISRHYLFIKTFRALQKVYIFKIFMMWKNSFVLLNGGVHLYSCSLESATCFFIKSYSLGDVFYWPLMLPYVPCGLCPLVRGRKVCRRGRKVCRRGRKVSRRGRKVCHRGWKACHTDSLRKSPHFGQHFSILKV